MHVVITRSHMLVRALAVSAGLVAGLNCGGDSGPSTPSIGDYVAALTDGSGAVAAIRHNGSPPAAGAGPTVTVTGGGIVITGGSTQASLTGSAAFTDVIVAVEGVRGYYQITLPAPVNAVDLLLTLGQRIPEQAFNLNYGIGLGAGAIGAYETTPVNVITVGTGEVQVSVSWNSASDVDLHVAEPGGEEVYYGNPQSATGGTLDLDSNPACFIDGKQNENITWASAPSGTYTVRVDYFAECSQTSTDYVVTVQRKGHPPETFSGNFTGAGDAGGQGSGTQITTFTFP